MKDKLVYVVTCFQNIMGVFENLEDASQVAQTFIQKGRPCDISCQIIK